MRRGFFTFTLILSTIAPAVLANTHLSLYVALPSIVLGFIIAYLTYLLVNVKWDYQGLYGYSRSTHELLGYVFLVSWLISYYLYVIYTAVYIPYYVLNLDGAVAVALSIMIGVIVVAALLTNPYYLFPVIALLQLLLIILPIGWRVTQGITPPVPDLFTNILSSSLLVVCITLSTFIRGEGGYSRFIIYSMIIGGAALLYGSFLKPALLGAYASAVGNLGLILAEFLMIKNLLTSLRRGSLLRILIPASMVLIAVGNINYGAFYTTLIVPSLTLLYLSLFVSFTSVFRYFKSVLVRGLGAITLGLFAYGDYSVLSVSRGYLLYEGVLSLILGLLIGAALYLRGRWKT
ncbi:hypothetical protein [Caldivirga maquilingensis]|uniref:hypothetical protein n=1 Tax=Caldivirga maquilingensis TaxID=76887 RepID=UPI000B11101D|nr:hypothetical protein [Caldivirga maquilingensis]